MKAPEVLIRRRGFTLTELLVVMGVIALLSALTALGYRSIAKDAKIASAKNTVMAVLDNARALAMKNNQIVLVVFRPRLEGKEEYVEAVTAKWTGDSGTADTPFGKQVVDRFIPIPGVPMRSLPVGIKAAGPFFGASGTSGPNLDDKWITMTHLPNVTDNGQGESPGEMLAVMFDSTGTTITASSATDAARIFVDFNNDGLQQFGNQAMGMTWLDYYSFSASDGLPTPPTIGNQFFGQYFEQLFESDEPYVDVVPYLAVFDDDKAREFYDITQWSTPPSSNPGPNRQRDYTEFITQNADRIHFNRYTGVAMK